MPTHIEVIDAPPQDTLDNAAKADLYQSMANHLGELINQRLITAEQQPAMPPPEPVEKPKDHPARHLVARSLGVAALGGGIYLETAGATKFGTALLVATGLLSLGSVSEAVMGFLERHKTKRPE